MANNGGPAFPTGVASDAGMSLRDYFAGQALIGILGSHVRGGVDVDLDDVGAVAEAAYRYADAMLKARK